MGLLQPDEEFDGVHECKGKEGEGGSDEVEERERGEDQVCCQLVVLRVTVGRKLLLDCRLSRGDQSQNSSFAV